MGSIGSSTKILEERRLAGEGAEVMKSEKLVCVESGGRGDRDRDVERELWPERVGRDGMCIVRESRRDDAPPVPQEVGAGMGFEGFRVREVSGNKTVDDAGLEAMALDDTEELSGRSQGEVFCRRNELGLI